jgi:hypothetical protein
MTSVNQSQSQFGPTIEDRIENTEKLIREMSYKFQDITSTKHSAKNEFNKLVQTLTMNSALEQYNVSDSGNEAGNEADNNEGDSNNSSFDEETMNLNHQNLKQFFRNKAEQERNLQNQGYPDKAQFSNSRYENVEEDDLDQYYDPNTGSYAVPESKIDLQKYKNHEVVQDDINSEQLYQNAKNSLNRTKILMMASQQDNEFINEMSFSDTENQAEMLNLSRGRVEKIIRNKEIRKTKDSQKPQYTYENMPIDSDSCKIQVSSEQDGDSNDDMKDLQPHPSRNQPKNRLDMSKDTYEGRYIHQTTSSANMVLYDSVEGRESTQSPTELLDPNFIEKVTGQYMQVYQCHDDEDLLQNEGVAGKRSNYNILDETYPRYYGNHSNSDIDENMADCDEDYDDSHETDFKGRKQINQYVHHLSGSKFKY